MRVRKEPASAPQPLPTPRPVGVALCHENNCSDFPFLSHFMSILFLLRCQNRFANFSWFSERIPLLEFLLASNPQAANSPSWVKVGLILGLGLVFVIVAALALHYGIRQSVTDTGLDQDAQIFMTAVSAAGARGVLQTLTLRPHIAGSIHDYNTALYVKSLLESFGFDSVKLEVFKTLLNRPLERSVRLLDASDTPIFTASLIEPAVPEDPTSNDTDSVLPFHGFSPAGGADTFVVPLVLPPFSFCPALFRCYRTDCLCQLWSL